MTVQGRYTPGLVEQWFESDNPNQVVSQASPGDFDYLTLQGSQRQLWVRCPGKCGTLQALVLRPVVKPTPEHPSWEFSGTENQPTLHPSYDHPGCWHGWLTDGVFSSV